MSAALLDSLSSLVTPDLTGKAASLYGESDSAIGKGFGALFPALLTGLANRAGEDTFASSLYNLVNDPANDGSILNNVGGLLGAGATSPISAIGGRLLSLLFGNDTGRFASALGGYAGIKDSTSNSLLSIAAPLVLAVLGRIVRSDRLNASSLASLLLGQKNAFAAAVPPALANIGSYFAGPASTSTAYAATTPAERKSSVWRWLLPVLIALGAIWLLSSLFGRRERPVDEVGAPAATEPAPAAGTTEPAAASTAATIYFDVDQASLPAGSDAQLAPVIADLTSNPGAVAVISGYHDPTGDQARNEELARNRAAAVRDALVAGGIDASRIDMQKPIVTEGGGSLEEARRVEVTVR